MSDYWDYYGIPLPKLADDEIPLGIIVGMKTMKDGKMQYREYKSSDMHAIEALGMVTTFSDSLRAHIMQGQGEH